MLRQITLAKDFLVKGSAGTGKTLVLLKAIEKAKGLASGDQGLLDLPDLAGSVALLTYNNTLVRYDQYVGDILCGQNPADRVCTADSFLYEKLRLVDPDFRVDYDLARELAAEHPVDGLSERELATEVDGFIWGNDLTFAEYVEEGIERRGMKRPLNRQQRAAVWRSAEAMERAMRERKVLARCLAARVVALEAEARPEDAAMRSVDYTFIDEVQDLPVAVLRALRACTRKCAVLAGDADQSIYQAGFTFRRAGIDVGGLSKILRTNFRNTVQLHQAAERFRAACPGMDGENQPEAFRDGPPPELFMAPTSEGLREVLLQRVDLFLVRLGYDPENLCVVAPTDNDLKALKRALEERGYAVSDIRDREFVFSTAGTIRLSTLHSVKGLDFPVVLLYLPRLHLGDGGHDEETAERLHRNLVYVALTRAMDHLNVFLPEETESAVLRDLGGCFGEPGKEAG